MIGRFSVDPITNSPTNIIRIVWQIVRRISDEILGVKGLSTRRIVYIYTLG